MLFEATVAQARSVPHSGDSRLPRMAARKRKLTSLDDLRRKVPHVSQRALDGIIAEIKRTGLPELGSRNHMRKGMELKVSEPTPYGPVSQELQAQNCAGKILVAHPLALIWKVVKECEPFAEFMTQCLERHPCSFERPWNLVLYADEVVPGDQIGGKRKRKFQAVYYSFMEFTPIALSHEDMWFTLTTTRSTEVSKLAGGMANVFGTIMKELFVEYDIANCGFDIKLGEATQRLFARCKCFLMDGAAHKSTWHCKSGASSEFCLLCKNL